MVFRIYNTLTKQVEEFKPMDSKKVTLYTCGPTVYNHQHIGNYRTMVMFDLMRRYLEFKGYEVAHVLNITDVDDKSIRDSKKEGISLKEFTERYADGFLNDLKLLNCLPAKYPRATDYIKEMVALVQELMKKEIVYEADDGFYFSVSKFKDYGKLSGVDLSGLEAGKSGRVLSDEYEKDQVNDFAVWKKWDEADGDVFWETELGKGRPGWHIECSAMIKTLLGQPIDMHMGGVDLIFPHHENEIAQSEAAYDTKFVNYWVHTGHLMVEGKKMSKSLGNVYLISDLIEKGISPKVLRYTYLAAHYRQKANLTFNVLAANEQVLKSLHEFMDKLNDVKGDGWSESTDKIDGFMKNFEEALDDDLNMSAALASLHEFVKECNRNMDSISKEDSDHINTALNKADSVLGFLEHEEIDVPEKVKKMAEEREQARKDKNFALADDLRDKIKSEGYYVDDTPEGIRIKKLGL